MESQALELLRVFEKKITQLIIDQHEQGIHGSYRNAEGTIVTAERDKIRTLYLTEKMNVLHDQMNQRGGQLKHAFRAVYKQFHVLGIRKLRNALAHAGTITDSQHQGFLNYLLMKEFPVLGIDFDPDYDRVMFPVDFAPDVPSIGLDPRNTGEPDESIEWTYVPYEDWKSFIDSIPEKYKGPPYVPFDQIPPEYLADIDPTLQKALEYSWNDSRAEHFINQVTEGVPSDYRKYRRPFSEIPAEYLVDLPPEYLERFKAEWRINAEPGTSIAVHSIPREFVKAYVAFDQIPTEYLFGVQATELGEAREIWKRLVREEYLRTTISKIPREYLSPIWKIPKIPAEYLVTLPPEFLEMTKELGKIPAEDLTSSDAQLVAQKVTEHLNESQWHAFCEFRRFSTT
ncbi:hypothetical protein LMG27952_06888 [Paraburkholderia hiiakae]|uniref:Uncharacterized protein n=2 Tax=Paraburkholderia hiiakae TaxID=1081782 RepID=A0ABM8P902_9BURK|nr:hypothetical protein LMG27952_06888 [Paraburkholderia hiiakae]